MRRCVMPDFLLKMGIDCTLCLCTTYASSRRSGSGRSCITCCSFSTFERSKARSWCSMMASCRSTGKPRLLM